MPSWPWSHPSGPCEPVQPGRRRFLLDLARSGALVTAGPTLWGLLSGATRPTAVAPVKRDLIVRSSRPLDLETPLGAFDSWLTPTDRFFVRAHFDAPRLDPATWRLTIKGLVGKPLSLSLDELRRFPTTTVTAVLQCSGNGRGLHRPTVPGVQWAHGAAGNARWTGIRLADVLHRAGIPAGAKHVWFQGGDDPVLPTTPAFVRSLPRDKALHPDTLLAFEMNGEPLPLVHGFPLRVIVPGWVGDDWLKWLTTITVAHREADGFYYKTGYRYPDQPGPAGAPVDPAKTHPMTVLNTKSLIARPLADASLVRALQEIRGVAWTGGAARIRQVEVSTDAGHTWSRAECYGPDLPYAWRQWRFRWTPPDTGTYVLAVRATDTDNRTQPSQGEWNPGGYLWNGQHAITVSVHD